MLNPFPVNMQAVPHGLERYRQFINWKLVPDEAKPGHQKKLPCDLYGKVINSHDPTHWLSAEEASASEYPIAFVFSDRDPFWFLDLDHAWDGFNWSPLAQWCIDFFPGCAVEISHSGRGLHLFGYGSFALPADHGCKNTFAGLEFYTRGRFCALTGTGRQGTAWIDFSERLPRFIVDACLKPRELDAAAVEVEEIDPRYTGPEDDAEVIRLMLDSRGGFGAMFGSKAHPRDLWHVNRDELARHWPQTGRADGVPFDWSAADASLMSHLSFWTGRNRVRMQRIFEQSGLYRESKYTGRGAYRMGLLLKEGMRNTKVYDRPRGGLAVAPVDPSAVAPSLAVSPTDRANGRSTMDITGQVEHFKGCVYVQSAHAVMVPDGRLLRPAVFNAVYGGYSFQMQFDRGKPTTEAFTAFTESRMMRFPSTVDTCFRPDLEPDAIVEGRINTWRPAEIKETPGDITPFLNHVMKMIPDAGDRRILFAYMQSLARNPGVKFQWAPVIQGAEGNGKSLLIRVLTYAIGRRHTHLPKASQITEKYNSWIEGRIFIGVEEIKVADRREVLEDLKDSVTNDWVEIRGMQQEKRMTNNYTNWLFCSNHKDAIPVDADQRRYAIFFTAQQSADDIRRDGMTDQYFVDLYDWLRNRGGYEAVAHWLRHAPIEAVEFDPAGMCQRAPATTSRVEAIEVSMGRIEQTILEAVDAEIEGFKDGWISTEAVKQWLQKRGCRDVNTRKLSDILKSLGYEHRFKSSVHIAEENKHRPNIYRLKSRVGGTQVEFMIAQGYHGTLRGGSILG